MKPANATRTKPASAHVRRDCPALFPSLPADSMIWIPPTMACKMEIPAATPSTHGHIRLKYTKKMPIPGCGAIRL